MRSIALVCGEFHRNYVEEMVNYAKDEATSLGIEISDIEWVPGARSPELRTRWARHADHSRSRSS